MLSAIGRHCLIAAPGIVGCCLCYRPARQELRYDLQAVSILARPLYPRTQSPEGGVITPSASSCMVRSSRSRACSGPSLYSQLARMKPRAARPLIRMSMSCGQPGHEKSVKWSSR